MDSVFKVLIAAIVFGALLAIILTFFVFPKDDPYLEISKTIKLAVTDAGNPYCSKIDLIKNNAITTKVLNQTSLLINESIYVWFSTLNPKLNVFNSDNLSSISSNESFKQIDFCAICFPGIIFKDYSDLSVILKKNNNYCEVVFGKKLLPQTSNLNAFNLEEQQGFKKINFNDTLPAGYIYAVYILNNEQKQMMSSDKLSFLGETKDTNIEKVFYFNNINKNDANIEIPKAGEKIVLQAIMQDSRNIFAGPIYPIKFLVQSINVIPNDNYQMIGCKTTTQENQGKDYDLQKCLVYNYCDGCFLASHCAKAWEDKGIISEAATTTYSKSYLPFESCN